MPLTRACGGRYKKALTLRSCSLLSTDFQAGGLDAFPHLSKISDTVDSILYRPGISAAPLSNIILTAFCCIQAKAFSSCSALFPF
jgi:hypothetical protein